MKARLARRADETRVWRQAGYRSAAHWVAATTGTTIGAASRTLETARSLDQLPATEEAFRAGRLSETQAAEIAGAAGADPAAEAGLVATAAETSVKGLRDRCRQVRQRQRPGPRRRRHHHRLQTHPDHSGQAAPRRRGPLPDLWRQNVCQRPVPRDRSCRRGRGPRPHRGRQPVADLPHHHTLKTHYGWRVVGSTHDWDLAPPDDPDPPIPRPPSPAPARPGSARSRR
jgi:hypothetical protein